MPRRFILVCFLFAMAPGCGADSDIGAIDADRVLEKLQQARYQAALTGKAIAPNEEYFISACRTYDLEAEAVAAYLRANRPKEYAAIFAGR